MADIRMSNLALEGDLDELNRQARLMSEAITEFTATVQANLHNFSGITPEELTLRTNHLNGLAGQMINNFGGAGQVLSEMVNAINDGDRMGGSIIAGG